MALIESKIMTKQFFFMMPTSNLAEICLRASRTAFISPVRELPYLPAEKFASKSKLVYAAPAFPSPGVAEPSVYIFSHSFRGYLAFKNFTVSALFS